MTGGLLGFLGGIGLFLFGMDVMTTALREVAGAPLRRLMAQFTATPLKGVITGAVATGVVQSSSAVTVMTIGFVGAGLIGFSQSLGILYGANIGTTLLGWVVMLAGVKLKLGIVALPALFVASLLAMLAQGWWARMGRFAAGFCLLFIGLDVMQAAMAGTEGAITPDQLPGESWLGLASLVGIGMVLIAILQSSGAGVAMVLVMLGAGSVSFIQAAALVIGMNVGTTFTGILASLGGGRAMRLTGLANLLFNLATGAVIFPFLGLMQSLMATVDPQTALVLFHSGFNILGALLFLPMTQPFAVLVQRLVPDRGAGLAVALDPAILSDEDSALDAAHLTATMIADAMSRALALALAKPPDLRPMAALQAQVGPALQAMEDWLAKVRVAKDHPTAIARYVALLHLQDHLTRLLARLQERDRMATLAEDSGLARAAMVLVTAMARGSGAARMERLKTLIEHRAQRFRRGTLLREHAGMIEVRDVFRLTDAMRWLERVAEHGERIAHYSAEAKAQLGT